jgi:hypothetical protein
MMNEAALRQSIMRHLVDKFGVVETERFISSVIKEPMDYTKWRRNMYDGMTVRELSAKAMECHRQIHNANE